MRDIRLGLVSQRQNIGYRQTAGLHGQVQQDVTALGKQRHTSLHPLTTVLVGPQQCAI